MLHKIISSRDTNQTRARNSRRLDWSAPVTVPVAMVMTIAVFMDAPTPRRPVPILRVETLGPIAAASRTMTLASLNGSRLSVQVSTLSRLGPRSDLPL